eukprot:gene1047-2628_t
MSKLQRAKTAAGHSKEFFELIRSIGESKSKQEEDKIISLQIAMLKSEVAKKDVDTGTAAAVVVDPWVSATFTYIVLKSHCFLVSLYFGLGHCTCSPTAPTPPSTAAAAPVTKDRMWLAVVVGGQGLSQFVTASCLVPSRRVPRIAVVTLHPLVLCAYLSLWATGFLPYACRTPSAKPPLRPYETHARLALACPCNRICSAPCTLPGSSSGAPAGAAATAASKRCCRTCLQPCPPSCCSVRTRALFGGPATSFPLPPAIPCSFTSWLPSLFTMDRSAVYALCRICHFRRKMKELMIRCIVCEMLGHGCDFAAINAVNLVSSMAISEKRVGYLACCLTLTPDHQMNLLLVSSVRK